MAQKHSISDDKVVKLLKQHPDQSMQFYANKLSIPLGAVGGYIYRLEPVADTSLKINVKGGDVAVNKRIVNARSNEGMRWERIAARTGMSVAEVKRRFKDGGGGDPNKSYTGRGRDFSGVARKPASSGSGSGRGGGRGGKQNTATSGRRAAAGGKKTGTAAGRGGTRGGNKAAAGRGRKDPS